MAQSFIFGGNTPWTYDQIQRKRRIAEQLASQIGRPRDVGEGLSAIGEALASRGINKRADKRDAELKGEFDKEYASIFNAGGGGGRGAPYSSPGGAPPVPVDPASPQGIGDDTMKALGIERPTPSVSDISSYISAKAAEMGIDPQTALAVAKSEGLNANPADGWQSNVVKNGKREESYGPFQLYKGGGLGNEFMDSTGLDPADPSTWKQQVDFALNHAKGNGWGAWYGARNTGIGNFQGIDGGGGGQPQAAGGMDMMTLANIAGSPYATPGQKAIVSALLQQQMQSADPKAALELQLLKKQVDAFGQPKPETPTDDMREYGLAKQQGFEGTLQDWIIGQKTAGASKTNINNTVGEGSSAYQKKIDEGFAQNYLDIQSGSGAARRKIATLQALGGSLKDAGETGFGAETVLGVKRAAKSLGLDVGDLGPEEMSVALGNQLALMIRSPSEGAGMPGAMSDKDREFLVASVPGLSKTPQGNAKIIDYMIKVEQRSIDVAKLAQKYAKENKNNPGQLDGGFDEYLAEWADANPLFEDSPQGAPAASGKPVARYNPQTGKVETITP